MVHATYEAPHVASARASGEAKCVAACASGDARRDDGVHFVLLVRRVNLALSRAPRAARALAFPSFTMCSTNSVCFDN